MTDYELTSRLVRFVDDSDTKVDIEKFSGWTEYRYKRGSVKVCVKIGVGRTKKYLNKVEIFTKNGHATLDDSMVCSADLIAATERSKHIFRQRVIQTVRELFEME